jgi:hypothetical protein
MNSVSKKPHPINQSFSPEENPKKNPRKNLDTRGEE